MQMQLTSEAFSSRPEQALLAQFQRVSSEARNGTVWFHQPHNLYLSDRQAETYLDLMRAPGYGGSFHEVLRGLIRRNRKHILAGLKDPIDLFDLGPGYPDKTFPLLDALRGAGRSCRYIPVDISRRFLRVVGDACRPFGFPIEPQNCLFEELPGIINRSAATNRGSRLVILGVTFMNYPPHAILDLMSQLLRPGDALLLAVELFQVGRVNEMMRPYQSPAAERFNFLVLDSLGVDPAAVEYRVRFRRSRIEMGFRFLRPVRLQGIEVPHGREVVTSVSYRHTHESFLELLQANFESVRIFEDLDRGCSVARVSSSSGAAGTQERRIKR